MSVRVHPGTFRLGTFTGALWYFLIFHTISPTDLLYSSPAPHLSTFEYISDLFSEMSQFQHRTNLCWVCRTSLVSSVNLSPILWWKEPSCWVILLLWKIYVHFLHHLLSCYKIIEIFLIFRLFVIYNDVFWGRLSGESHYLSSFHIHFHSITSSNVNYQSSPFNTVSALASSSRSSTYFVVQITFSHIFKSPNPWRTYLITYLPYKSNRFGDKQHPCLTPLPIFLSPGPVLVQPSDPCTISWSICFRVSRYWLLSWSDINLVLFMLSNVFRQSMKQATNYSSILSVLSDSFSAFKLHP